MSINLILVPYDLGHRDRGMGAGPNRLLDLGADQALTKSGHQLSIATVHLPDPPGHEVGACLKINSLLSDAVRAACQSGERPIVLAGNCNSCLGTIAGLDDHAIGVTWFDAHGDFNSPDTSASGFFDGMALNILTGGSWTAAARTIPGFTPVREQGTVLMGVRDLDLAEQKLLDESGVIVMPNDSVRPTEVDQWFSPAVESLGKSVEEVYVHVDLDVLDRDTVPANEHSPPGGLLIEELEAALEMIGARFVVRAAALTAYNPNWDADDRAGMAGVRVLETLGEIVGQ